MGINIEQVSKSFGKKKVLSEINITLENNKIYGLLGRNGVGKSTLMKIISNRMLATTGEIRIDGQSKKENGSIYRQVYYVNDENLFPEEFKVKDVIKWTRKFYCNFNDERCERLLAEFKVPIKTKYRKLSTGYKMILKCIMGLCVDVNYLLLDEPVLGLDAYHRELIYQEIIKNYAEQPKTILISTHLIEEIANVVGEIFILNQQQIMMQESVDELIRKGKAVSGKKEKVLSFLEGENIIGLDELGNYVTAYVMTEKILEHTEEEIEVRGVDLQKLFIHLTKEEVD